MRKVGDDPTKIREALEDIAGFKGVLRDFDRSVFTQDRGGALLPGDLLMTRWTSSQMLPL